MWDEDDYISRWIQGICGIFLGMFALLGAYVVMNHLVFYLIVGGIPVVCGAGALSWKCLRYAITGQGSPNRENF